jgi:membrane protein DedA with SNARE-associated domain
VQPTFYEYFIVYLTGILGIWKAIPVGLVLELDPVSIYLMTTTGAITGILILYFFGSRIREWVINRRKRKGKSGKESRAANLFGKYGVPGLGILGCLLMGPNMTMIVGLILVPSPKKLFWWTLVGIVLWSLVLTIIAVLSLELFNRIMNILNF